MVQPTRMVCCACDALRLANSDTAAPAATTHFETICMTPCSIPVFGWPRRRCWAKPFMVQMIGQAAEGRGSDSGGAARCGRATRTLTEQASHREWKEWPG